MARRSAWYTELKPQLDAILKGKDDDPKQQAETLKKQLATRDEQIATLNQQQTDLKEQLSKLKSDRNSTEQELTQKREHLESEIEKLNTTIKSTSADKDAARRERDTARLERDNAREEATRFKSELESVNDDLRHLKDERNHLQRRMQDVSNKLEDTTSKLRTTEDHLVREKSKLANVSGELEQEKRQPAKWYWEKFSTPKTLFSMISLGFLVGIVFGVLFWVGEVRGRQKLELFLTTKIEKLREDLANGADDSEDQCQKRRLMLCEFEKHLNTLQTLTVSGSDQNETTLGEIRNSVFSLIANGPPESPPSEDEPAEGENPDDNLPANENEGNPESIASKKDTPENKEPPERVWILWQFVYPRYMASDLLLSLVVIMSGAVGAVVAALRATRALSLADLGFGVAAGFITLLAIRGGKNVFMVSNEDVSFYLNPYSSAFVGLLAGLFTDKAYELLRKFVEKLVKGMEKTFELDADPRNDSSSQTDGGQPASNPSSDSTTPAATPTTSDPTAEKQPDGKPTDSSED